MEKDKKVTALYCRLSKDDGSNSESLSIRTQKAMLMEYATRNGFGNCQYYVDDGYSGTNSDRPAFQELLDDIREGKVATVITKDQSRLGRNHIETGTYMEIFFPEHGVRYIAINDGYDSNEQSQMDIAPFRNIINEMYAKDTSRKIKSALRTRKKSGKYISSGAPFGYQKDPADHNHLVIDPNTAPVVEYIYSMAEEGLGLHRIAKRLHDEKVLKPCYYKKEMFGRFIDDEKMYDWDSAYISQVLHSPVYAGHIIYEAKPTVSMKSKKRRYIPFEERAIVPNTHEAIIPQDRWENVQRILYSRSSSFMCDKTDYDNIFKGIVRCADCGRTMLVKVEHRRKRNSVLDQTFYCCSTYRKYGAKACDSHNLEARVLHEAVFADIQAHAKAAVSNREALVKKIANQMHLRVSSDRAQHKRDLKQCKARIAEIEDLYLRENTSGVGYATYDKLTLLPLEKGQIPFEHLPPDGRNAIPAARNWFLFELSDDPRRAIQLESVRILDNIPDSGIRKRRIWEDPSITMNDVRLIDSNYKDLYRVPNGSVIQVDYPDGRSFTTRLEHWDEYHFDVGGLGDMFHICQFAEVMERNGASYYPEIQTQDETGAWIAVNFGLIGWTLIRAKFLCRIWHWPICGCRFFGKNRCLLSGNCTNSKTKLLTPLPKKQSIIRSGMMSLLNCLPEPSRERSAMLVKPMCASTPVRRAIRGATRC